MKEGGVSHAGNEYHPYANGSMQHMYNNSRQTPDSGLGNDDSRNSMNNASGGGDTSSASAGGGAPPGFQPNPYYGMAQQSGNAQQSQYNDQHQFRQKQYNSSQNEGGRFERSGPPSIVTMHTTPPNMDQDGGPSYPNYGNYSQYAQGGPSYGGMDRNYNGPHQIAGRSHSNYSESSSGTLNIPGGPPDATSLSGQPLMSGGPQGGMMYPQGGPPICPPYGHPMQQMQQSGGYMYNPLVMAAHQHAQMMMQGGQMNPQMGPPQPMPHPQPISMGTQQQQGTGGGTMPPPPPPQSVTPPQGMMVPMVHGATIGPLYYPHPAMMAGRGPMVGQSPDGFVQFTYPNQIHGPVPQQQPGFSGPRGGNMLQHQRSVNSPALSDNTDGQSVQGPPSIGMWNGPPDQQSQHSSPPGSIHSMQAPQQMQQGQMNIQAGTMMPVMSTSYPGAAGGVPPYGGPNGTRMVPGPMMTPHQHIVMQQQGMPIQHFAQMQPYGGPGGYPPQPQSGYWSGPGGHPGRGGYRGGTANRDGRGGWRGGGGGRPGSRQQYNSRNNSITSGGRRDNEELKCTTPEDEIIDMSLQLDTSLRMGGDQSMEGVVGSCPPPHKQLLQLADSKCSSPPAEPHPSTEGDSIGIVNQEEEDEVGTNTSIPTTPRTEQRRERKELLEMKKTPKSEKTLPQTIPIDPLPHGETLPVGRKYSEVAGRMTCTYCKDRKLTVEEYSNHRVRDPMTHVCTCPLLRAAGCQLCGLKGDQAHDQFFCSKRETIVGHGGQTTCEPIGHVLHPLSHGDKDGGYRGVMKKGGGGGGGGGHYTKGGRGGHGGERRHEARRDQQ